MPSLWARLMLWLCDRFGHRGRVLYDCPGGGDSEVCTRCHRLLSTAYSRNLTQDKTP
jgi:hypothetical protein